MGEHVAKPHDRFFRHVLQQPEAAKALLRERLRPDLAAALGAGSFVAFDTTLVDRAFHAARPDKLLRVRLRTDAPELLYCVVEHKSAPDPRAPVQMLGYFGSVASLLNLQHPPPEGLPSVWGIVVYHGKRIWKAPLSYRALVAWPPGVHSRGGGDADYDIFDVGAEPDKTLSADPVLRAGLMAMKYATRPAEQARALPKILVAAAQAPQLRSMLLDYIQETFESVDEETITEVERRVAPEMEAVMPTIASKHRAEARAEKGAHDLLLLLEKRFGPVPTPRTAEIKNAGEADLERWLIRILDARTLDDVFA